MQFSHVSLLMFVAFAAAQTNSTTTLSGLVKQLPTCALSCFSKAASTAGCATTDFTCLCGTGQKAFVNSIGPCVFLACDSADTKTVTTLAPEICSEVAANPSTSDVAQASNIVTSALGSATSTTSGNVAPTRAAAMGAVGIAAVAALAL